MRKWAILAVSFLALILTNCTSGGIRDSHEAASADITDGAENVSASGSYGFTFSKAVNSSTVTTNTFYVATVTGGNASLSKGAFSSSACTTANRVAGSVSCSSSTSCTYTTTDPLLGNTQYVMCLTSGIIYADGTTYIGSTDSFTTGPAVDSITPTRGATDIATSSTIVVTFSAAIQASTLTSSTFTVTSASSQVSGTITLDADLNTATFTPDSSLNSYTTYAVTLTSGIKDSSGNALTEYSSTFKTAAAPAASLTVTSISPISGATDVSSGTSISVMFSDAVQSSTINTSSFLVRNGGTYVSGTVSYDSTSGIATFTPQAALGSSKLYVVELTAEVTSSSSTSLSAFTSTFTTVAASPTCTVLTCADIHALILANNSTGIRPSTAFTATTLTSSTCLDGATPTYSMTGTMPTGLSFNAATNQITGTTVSSSATGAYTVVYGVTNGSFSGSVTCLLNDMDGDTMTDHKEYTYGEVPLVNNTFGWVWLTATTDPIYRPATDAGVKMIPTGLTKPTEGLNLNDATDAAADFDGDGLTNLAEINAETNIFVAESDGTFAAAVAYVKDEWAQMVVADFDNDGDLDIASEEDTGYTLRMLKNNGAGTFTDSAVSCDGEATCALSAGSDIAAIVSGDFNNDGYQDLAMVDEGEVDAEVLSVLINNGTGAFTVTTFADYLGGDAESMVAADFNKDGFLDISIIRSENEGVDLFWGNGEDTIFDTPPESYNFGLSGLSWSVTADFNNDLALDIAAADGDSAGGTVNYASALKGTGSTPAFYTTPMSYNVGSDVDVKGITSGDFNFDGNLDIATANFGGDNISILLGKGNLMFNTKVDYEASNSRTAIVTGDLDGDGDLDIAVAAGDSDALDPCVVDILFGDGTGLFGTKTTYTLTEGECEATTIASADLNNDGKLDLAINVETGIYILLSQ